MAIVWTLEVIIKILNSKGLDENGKPKQPSIVMVLLEKCIGKLKELIEFFNSLAYVRVAGKNETFYQAVKETFSMMGGGGTGSGSFLKLVANGLQSNLVNNMLFSLCLGLHKIEF